MQDNAMNVLPCLLVAAATAAGSASQAVDEPRPPFDGKHYRLTLVGDVTGDGAVTHGDLLTAIDNYGVEDPLIIHGDVNGDGRVDMADIEMIYRRIGLSMADRDVLWNADDRQHVQELVDAGHVLLNDERSARQWNRVYNRGDRWPRGLDQPVHDETVSASWEEEAHEVPTSQAAWPDGHFWNFSDTWPTDHDGPGSSMYPPNHSELMSNSWPSGHQGANSDRWPPMHDGPESQEWIAQGHGTALSSEWPPAHDYSYSLTIWPTTDHQRVDSRQEQTRPPAYHQLEITSGWPQNPPQIWPPMHYAQVSTSWPGTHAVIWSYSWPPNHWKSASETWDPQEDNDGWPGSHTKARSDAQGN